MFSASPPVVHSGLAIFFRPSKPKKASRGPLEFVMAQVCSVCGKGPQFGNSVSHANNKNRRRWNPNLHPVKAKMAGSSNTRRVRVCSSCLRAGKVTKG